MSTTYRFAAAISVAAALVMAPVPLAAQITKPRPEPGNCRQMAKAQDPASLWWGRFAGGKYGSARLCDHCIESVSVEACFTTERDCDLWLYWMQSDYPDVSRIVRCDKGYRK